MRGGSMRWITTVFSFALTVPVWAEDAAKVSLLTNPFNEIVRTAPKISGTSFMGLVAQSSRPEAAGVPRIAAWLPGDWAGNMACLRVISSDGLYEAQNSYAIAADWLGGLVELPYPSRATKALQERRQVDIALAVTKGGCDGAGDEASLALWADEPATVLTLYVNSFRADEVLVYHEDQPELAPVNCDRAGAENRTAFDMVCALPAEWFAGAAVNVTLLPVKNGEIGQETQLRLRGGQLQ